MIDTALLVKLLAAPTLIGFASLAGKRWGPNIAGLMGGLPLVGAPVILALWIEKGSDYAREAALSAPAGVWANIVYMLALGYASARLHWYAAIPLAWAFYLLTALILNALGLAQSLALGFAVVPGLWIAALYGLPRPVAPPRSAALPPIELVARLVAAALLVYSLATLSGHLGAQLTGILSGAPVAAVVIPAFIFAKAGRDALLLTLRGFLTGLMGFAVFFLILGHTMAEMGVWSLLAASLGGIATGLLATHQSRRIATTLKPS